MASRSPATEVEQHDTAVRRDRPFFLVSAFLFVATAVATALWCESMSAGMQMPGGWTMSMAWMRMPGETWSAAAGGFLGMWTLMMVAMMLPSLAPSLSSYRRSIRALPATRAAGLTLVAGAGYFAVWVALGACVYLLGIPLAAAEMRWEWLARTVPLAIGAALVLAGWVQLSGWKARQLGQCRSSVGVSSSTDGPVLFAVTAWRFGLHLGVRCVLCCSGLVIVLLVLGVMDLRVMAIVTAVVTLERLAPGAEQIARAAGVIILGAGLFVMTRVLVAT
jgi:predicted metal-binding membrane protein